MSHNLELVGRAYVFGRLRAALDRGFGKQHAVFCRVDDALYAPVETRGERRRIGSDGDTQVGVEPQHVGRQQGGGPHALAVLRRHRYHQPAHTSGGKLLEQTVVCEMESLQFEKRIYLGGELRERQIRPCGPRARRDFGFAFFHCNRCWFVVRPFSDAKMWAAVGGRRREHRPEAG